MVRNPLSSQRLTENECAGFARSFSVLLSAAWTIPRILEAILKQTKNKKLSEALTTLKDKTQKGTSLSEAIQSHKVLFGPLICAVIAATEPAGSLGNGFAKCADYYEKNASLHATVSRKLRYPFLVIIAAAGIIASLFSWFIPDALARISGSGIALPLPTRTTLLLISGIRDHCLLLVSIAAELLLVIALAWYLNSRLPILARTNWGLPFIGTWLRQRAARRFLLAFSTLAANNVDPAVCLRIAMEASQSGCLKARLANSTDVTDTVSLIDLLETTGMLPDIIIDTLKTARTGEDLADALKKASEFYQEKLEAFFNSVILIIEPVVVAILGLAATGLLVALYLPFGFH